MTALRNWRRRWAVDLAACTATHDSGLVVADRRSPDDDALDFAPLNLDEWQAAMLNEMPITNLVPHLIRLMREASEVYQAALRRRH